MHVGLGMAVSLAQARLQLASRLPLTYWGAGRFIIVNGTMLAAILHCNDNNSGTTAVTSCFLLGSIITAADVSILSSRVAQRVPIQDADYQCIVLQQHCSMHCLAYQRRLHMHQQQEQKIIMVKVALFVLKIAMQCMLQLKQYMQS